MPEYFPTSFTTVQPGPGTVVLGDNGLGPVNVDTSQIATDSYVMTTVAAASAAYLISPNFTGLPTAPTAEIGSDDTQIANTAFVQQAVQYVASGGTIGVTSFDGRTGNVTLMPYDVSMALGYVPAPSGGSITETFDVAPSTDDTNAPQTFQVQSNSFNYTSTVSYTPSGSAYAATYFPPINQYYPGQVFWFSAPISNSASATFNAGPGPMYIYGGAGSLLQGGEISESIAAVVVNASASGFNLLPLGGSIQVAPASGSIYATPLGQVQSLILAASGTLAPLNGSITETFSVAPAASGYEAPQWSQVYAGDNAAWNNETANRALNTTYTNTQGKPISVSVVADSDAANQIISLNTNGVKVASSTVSYTAAVYMGLNATVLAGATYEITATTGVTLVTWYELY